MEGNEKHTKRGFGTTCVRNTVISGKKVYPHREPIHPTSAFTYPSAEEAMELFKDQDAGFIYGRWNNPTVESAANTLEALESHGTDIPVKARLFASGMAAIAAVMMAHLKPGDKILTQNQLYGGTDELLRAILEPNGITRINGDLNDSKELAELLELNAEIKLIYLESPSNPMLNCVSISKLAKIAKNKNIKVAVDNTFCTPYLQQPLKMGADFSIYSTTKFLNGHGNALGGAVIGSDLQAMNGSVFNQLKLIGGCIGPFDAWLLLNGLKTLELRMDRHCSNAKKVAAYLSAHPKIISVNYLGDKKNPFYKLASEQMAQPCPMISFEVEGGIHAGIKLINALEVCVLATTLGTLDTVVQHPASMTHAPVPATQRQAQGITDGLVRMSVGIENPEDIIADLAQGLEKI
ncbi:MAG: methionine-gamma-lyase [Limisphaerales bacterium]|jgi:methionine-gamma-lyase